MDRKALRVCLFLCSVVLPARSMHGRNFEISGNAGFGVAERDGFGLRSVPSGGATVGWLFRSTHKLQFDYAFGHMERETAASGGYAPSIHNRHFFTGSYVLQKPQGSYRPFLQIGAGVQRETNNDNQVVNRFLYSDSRTAFAGVAGAGLTIELGRSIFLRPQIRTFIAPGPAHNINVTALPSCALGWRF